MDDLRQRTGTTGDAPRGVAGEIVLTTPGHSAGHHAPGPGPQSLNRLLHTAAAGGFTVHEDTND